MDKSKLGLIHIYTGNGKGKTTAALGLILRASGRGLKVVLGQFLKGRETGELHTLTLLPGVKVFRGKPLTKFSFQMNEQEKADVLQSHNEFIKELAAYCKKEETDLLVLDEVIGVYQKVKKGKIFTSAFMVLAAIKFRSEKLCTIKE